MVACRCEREIGREGVDAAAGVGKSAVDSSSGMLDVEGEIADYSSRCSAASVVTERPWGFGRFLEAMRLASHAPGSRSPS